MAKFGFELNLDKLVPLTTYLIFLGILIDSMIMELSLPSDKLADIQHIMNDFLSKQRIIKRQLQRLAGKLNFASRVVRGQRTFVRRILDVIGKIRRQNPAGIQDCPIGW